MHLQIVSVHKRPNISYLIATHRLGHKVLEHTHRFTIARPGWKVLAEVGDLLSAFGMITLLIFTIGTLKILLDSILHMHISDSALDPRWVAAVIILTLLVIGLTRTLKQQNETVISVHAGGILLITWQVYRGEIVQTQAVRWDQITGGERYENYDWCQLKYQQDDGKEATFSLSDGQNLPYNKRNQASFRKLMTEIEWQIHGLRGKPLAIVKPPASDTGDTE